MIWYADSYLSFNSTLQLFALTDGGETFLDVSTVQENITVKQDQDARWVINVSSFPLDYDFIWKNPKGEEIHNKGGQYNIQNRSKEGEHALTIRVAKLEDMGPYPLTVQNLATGITKTLNLYLSVKGIPKS